MARSRLPRRGSSGPPPRRPEGQPGVAGGPGSPGAGAGSSGRPSVLLLVAVITPLLLALASGAQASSHGLPPSAVRAGMRQVVVKPGQSLWSVAQNAEPKADPRVVIQQIMEFNALGSQVVVPGESLWVPRADVAVGTAGSARRVTRGGKQRPIPQHAAGSCTLSRRVVAAPSPAGSRRTLRPPLRWSCPAAPAARVRPVTQRQGFCWPSPGGRRRFTGKSPNRRVAACAAPGVCSSVTTTSSSYSAVVHV